MTESAKADADILKSKTKVSKETSVINDRLVKLEKQKRSLETSNSKQKKNYLKAKTNAKKSRLSRKFLNRDAKIKRKNRMLKDKKTK